MADEPAMASRPRRRWRWTSWTFPAVALVVIAASLTWALSVIPRWLYPPLPAAELGQIHDPARRIEVETNRLKLQSDTRATLLQGLAGIAVLGGAIVAARQLRLGREQLQHNLQASREQLELSRSGQITERFTRAIDQLGTQDQLEVVLGGIYALERIARDSPDDRATIAEVLTAYVLRSHAPWPPHRPGQYVAGATVERVPAMQTWSPDVQAALTVLGRGQFPVVLDLHGTDLRRAALNRADLKGALLGDANLQGAWLRGANLQGANLGDADLRCVQLHRDGLRGARADGTTHWPDGFDPRSAGVLVPSVQDHAGSGGAPPA